MKSVYLRRIMIVFTAVMIATNILLVSAYSFFGKQTYLELEIEDMESTLNSAQDFYELRDSMLLNSESFGNALRLIEITSDAKIFFYFDDPFEEAKTNITQNEYLVELITQILQGNLITDKSAKIDGESYICIGAPLYSERGVIEGGIIVAKTTESIDNAFDRLNSILWIMIAFLFPPWIIAAYLGTQKLSKPMQEMTNIAIQVTNGNYDVRANEQLKGEMGIFARAMNRMSEEISKTIYQLNSEKRQLGYILSSFSEGVAAIDECGQLTHYNPALMRMFGSVEVHCPNDLIADRTIWDAFHDVVDSKEQRALEYTLPGDKTLWISIVPVISDEGNCIGAVGLFKDMTETERLERMRREYVANISHELRTPLTAVRGLLEPLSDGMIKDEETKERYYSIMLKEVERLSRLITDMLQLSRLQSGTEYMEVKSFDINELLGDIVQSYKNTAKSRGIHLEFISQDLPNVLSDPDRIEQVVIILLDNAIRYANGIVEISTYEDSHYVHVVVSDNGCGISAEDLPHIFERFYKADKSRNEGGTGLGLSIARQIMDKLGEEITVESKLGEGTCFSFSIKKYVTNAIPLGPAGEISIIEPDIKISSTPVPLEVESDLAEYEVIEPPKPKKRRS